MFPSLSSLICCFCALLTHVVVSEDSVQTKWSNSWAVEIKGGQDVADQIAAKNDFINFGPIGSLRDMYHFVKHDTAGTFIKEMANGPNGDLAVGLVNDPEVKSCHQQTLVQYQKRYTQPQTSTNPLLQNQWPVNNTGQTGETILLLDLNIEPAWIQGYTGDNITVGVVDDGIDRRHADLADNYDSFNSFDYYDSDSDPNPFFFHSHGTACAGEIGMVRGNSVCGVGVAYNSKLAGLRLIAGPITDAQIAGSLSHNRGNIDIYSNSWGPFDSGALVLGPGPMTVQALREGATEGRNNLGNIFTFAAGNGGAVDTCTADGFAQSIYTIPVGSYSQNGGPAYYDEKCSAKMTVAYVSNTLSFLQVATLGRNNHCIVSFGGTSSATPYVAAIIALTLDANPALTWRDVQYLIVYTSNTDPLVSLTDDEFTNGAGLIVSHQFGFGAIDADAMVTRAQRWINVPSQIHAHITPSVTSGSAFYTTPLEITFTYSGSIVYIEHLVVTMTLEPNGSGRGNLEATITSPNNTVSKLLFTRPYDGTTVQGYTDWPFLSVLHWGENPTGNWTIRVYWNAFFGYGSMSNVEVTIYGVSQIPQSVANIPSQCDLSCARGCSGTGSLNCDACNSTLLRNATTLECIQPSECVSPNKVASGYCYFPDPIPSPSVCRIKKSEL